MSTVETAIHTSAPRSVVTTGAIEATTYLVLLATALWRVALDGPDLAGVVGPVHGIAVLAYFAAVLVERERAGWPASRTISMLVASVVPFAGFVVPHRPG